jgi:hypothetical protein
LKRLPQQHLDRELSTLITDDYKGYSWMGEIIEHYTVNHSVGQYATSGGIHAHTIEGFWALLKRGIIGQYHVFIKQIPQTLHWRVFLEI